MTQKLGTLVEIMLARKMTWNVDTTLKLLVGSTELGALAITGKVEYSPLETERKIIE